MLATLNSRQIVDEIVKDTVKDNDPHDAIQISPDMVLASRPISVAPALAPELTARPEPKLDLKFAPPPSINPEPKFSPVLKPPVLEEPRVLEPQAATPSAVPSVDTAVRVAADDGRNRPKRSSAGKWLRRAFVTMLLAGGSVGAAVAWEKHGDTARQMLAEWTPALTSWTPALASLLHPTSQTAPVTAAQAAPPAEQPATAQATDQTATPPAAPAVQVAAAAPVATQPVATQPDAAQPDTVQSVQSMTRDLAAMAQQIDALKANIAELKAGQEQMAREMAKPPAPRPVAEARPVDPRARVSSARPPMPPVRKPKPVVSQTYMPSYSPAPLAPPPPSQAAAVAPAAPVATTQAVADDDGPVVRPPMPLR
ncbi:hypothetical protein [Bradyrhizobium sp. CCGB20]|uniref:hypothetical protein n=1 Tax=Bradyrhizobium sp. CCGB20 TaxID=2949633 RepID=UPI0020B3A44D|nr:hypothetical protein [Bradyrhizobium sp. CCGB20]MCP3399546.1 hypothetical protein [Bradyrhizobium sp. CCGB20]